MRMSLLVLYWCGWESFGWLCGWDGRAGLWWPSLYYRCDLDAFLGSRLAWSSDQALPRLLVAKHAVLNDTRHSVYT
jgi:hypothetical protein